MDLNLTIPRKYLLSPEKILHPRIFHPQKGFFYPHPKKDLSKMIFSGNKMIFSEDEKIYSPKILPVKNFGSS